MYENDSLAFVESGIQNMRILAAWLDPSDFQVSKEKSKMNKNRL